MLTYTVKIKYGSLPTHVMALFAMSDTRVPVNPKPSVKRSQAKPNTNLKSAPRQLLARRESRSSSGASSCIVVSF